MPKAPKLAEAIGFCSCQRSVGGQNRHFCLEVYVLQCSKCPAGARNPLRFRRRRRSHTVWCQMSGDLQPEITSQSTKCKPEASRQEHNIQVQHPVSELIFFAQSRHRKLSHDLHAFITWTRTSCFNAYEFPVRGHCCRERICMPL